MVQQLLDEVAALAQEKGVGSRVDFMKNVGWDELRRLLGHSAVGLHTMWCEHFGIGVVQMMVRLHPIGTARLAVEVNEQSTVDFDSFD